ncbi:MAG: ATP-dependent 6-phosphofructokinase [Fibrobacteria bacterium]
MGKRFSVLTSGGDAPGMNACLRSIVRVATSLGHEVLGARRGFQGLIDGDFISLGPRDVSNCIQRGGTLIHTSRCEEFRTEAGILKAASQLKARNVDALLAIGGDGTFRGCVELGKVWSGKILGLPGTIDNDLWGTDYTIGFDTAVNTALESIDKIRDTAESHERFFLVEVMGRHSGFIALEVGITGGAEEILVPEESPDLQAVCYRLCAGKTQGKTSSLIIVAEGAYPGGVKAVAEELKKLSGNEYRLCVLGHVQRGGSPTAADRLLGTRLGAFSVEAALEGASGKMVGEVGGKPVLVDLLDTFEKKKSLDRWIAGLVRRFST